MRPLIAALSVPRHIYEFYSCSANYSFTGINPKQSKALTEEAHVYLTTNGRISMAGLNSKNINYFAENLDKVVREELRVT